MTLDEYTAAFMTALVGAVASIAFILETVIRRDTGPGRLWATGYFCGLSATLAYAAWAAGVGGTFAIAVGNVMFVLVPGFVWLGSRQFSDRALRTPAVVVAVGAVATFAAALIDAAQPDGWGGWPVMAASLVVLFIAAAVEALRAPLRLIRSSWAFAAVLLAAALFYAVRLMVFVIAGPESAVFQQWFGPTAANIVTVVLTMVAVIVTSVLRANRTSRQRYAWLTRGGVAADGILLARTSSSVHRGGRRASRSSSSTSTASPGSAGRSGPKPPTTSTPRTVSPSAATRPPRRSSAKTATGGSSSVLSRPRRPTRAASRRRSTAAAPKSSPARHPVCSRSSVSASR